jgi:hypothetical protein
MFGMSSEQLEVNVEVEPDQVIDLIQAVHFLGIKSLLNVAATMVAHHLSGNLSCHQFLELFYIFRGIIWSEMWKMGSSKNVDTCSLVTDIPE